jgi:hypothetical protein
MDMQLVRSAFSVFIRPVGLVMHGVAIVLSASAQAADWVSSWCSRKSCIHLDNNELQSFWGAMPVVIKVQDNVSANRLQPKDQRGSRPTWVE